MDIIYLLIPLALVLLGVAVAAFFWAVRNDQFEDLDREASRVLFEEDDPTATADPPGPDHAATEASPAEASGNTRTKDPKP
ncbi:MAG: cbb3-type cytochrome oxidase assembly protein CcoS [Pseudomonadales bacterium]|nr:cbb3-type cytochrome oxidase assembly protein CcoS [Pseudomonadales bacterium]